MSDSIDLFKLLEAIDRLKHLKRTGWLHHGIPEPETVASHMYRMAVLAMTLGDQRKDLDVNKCVRMALVHDIGEAIVGDITPRCGISGAEKFELEHKALQEISSWLPPTSGTEWMALWLEYEAASTPEAKAVKQLDKLDMLAQALSYEQKHSVCLDEFFTSTISAFTEEPFINWATKIREKHEEVRSEIRLKR